MGNQDSTPLRSSTHPHNKNHHRKLLTPTNTQNLYQLIIIISSLPKGRSLASKLSNSLGFQPSSSYPHMSHLIHHRSCPLLAFPLVSFLPFSLVAPISIRPISSDD